MSASRRSRSSIVAAPRAATPIAFVKAVTLGYERYRLDPRNALRAAQIPSEWLDDPAARITSAQMEALCHTAMRELDDEALGWFTRRLPWGSYGLLCRASLGSPTLGVAIKRWCRHHGLLTDNLLISLRRDGADAVVSVEERCRFGPVREFCLVTILRYLHGFACWSVDSRIPLRDVAFPFASPPHHEVYPLIFPGPVRFDAGRTEMRFHPHYLDLALRRDEPALRAMLQRALPLTVRVYRRDRLLKQGVESLLLQDPGAYRNAEQLAAALGVSTRGLHRQLRDEGTSLQQLRDGIRCKLAWRLLTRTRKPIKRVASDVGFLSDKSFSRAFRSWTGKTPEEARLAAFVT